MHERSTTWGLVCNTCCVSAHGRRGGGRQERTMGPSLLRAPPLIISLGRRGVPNPLAVREINSERGLVQKECTTRVPPRNPRQLRRRVPCRPLAGERTPPPRPGVSWRCVRALLHTSYTISCSYRGTPCRLSCQGARVSASAEHGMHNKRVSRAARSTSLRVSWLLYHGTLRHHGWLACTRSLQSSLKKSEFSPSHGPTAPARLAQPVGIGS